MTRGSKGRSVRTYLGAAMVPAMILAACATPARAGCPPPLNGSYGVITINSHNRTNTHSVHQPVQRTEILNYLYDILGHAELKDAAGQSTHWYAEAKVSDTEFPGQLVLMKQLMEADVASVPGTTVAFTSTDFRAGQYLEFVDSSYEEVLNHTETAHHTEITVSCTDGPGLPVAGVDYFPGDSTDPADWVAVNNVTADIDNYTDITNYIDDVTTEYDNDVTMWAVEVYREVGPEIIFSDGFEGTP